MYQFDVRVVIASTILGLPELAKQLERPSNIHLFRPRNHWRIIGDDPSTCGPASSNQLEDYQQRVENLQSGNVKLREGKDNS